jgi:hypothetical protein
MMHNVPILSFWAFIDLQMVGLCEKMDFTSKNCSPFSMDGNKFGLRDDKKFLKQIPLLFGNEKILFSYQHPF